MGLTLCNSYRATIWASIMFYSPDSCGGEGQDFEMMGWWRVEPGSCALVYANDLADVNRYWFVYAETADRSAVWSGPWQRNATRDAFGGDQWCWGIGKDVGELNHSVAYLEVDVGNSDDHTVTFVP